MRLLTKNCFWLTKLEEQQEVYDTIASLDPLNIDTEIKLIPGLNQQKDVRKLIAALYNKLPRPNVLNAFNYKESLAAMRDLGIYMGSIKRHGIEPVEAVPELDYVLDILSSKTNLPPRDTLLHYTVWNPLNSRVRTYTHHADEVELIRSVRISTLPLMKGIYYLVELSNTPLDNPYFEVLCAEACKEYKDFIEGIVLAKRKVSPQVFAKELRLYFDPIRIYNEDFIGPGAVEMPLFVFDHILWGSDLRDEEYRAFSRTYVPFNLPSIRDIYYNYDEVPSLVTKTCRKLKERKVDKQVVQSAKALHRLCKLGRSFRIPHKKLADEAYQHEPESQREKGSGGYSTDILAKTLELNTNQCDRLATAIGLNA